MFVPLGYVGFHSSCLMIFNHAVSIKLIENQDNTSVPAGKSRTTIVVAVNRSISRQPCNLKILFLFLVYFREIQTSPWLTF